MDKEIENYRKRRQARLDAKANERKQCIDAYRQRRWNRLDARGFSFEEMLNIAIKGGGKPLMQKGKHNTLISEGIRPRRDDGDKDVIYRTAENGNKYAINASTGEILGGLGPELEGQKVGRILSEQAPSVQKMFDSLDKMPVGTPAERRAFAEKLIDNMGIDRTGIDVLTKDMDRYGACTFHPIEDGNIYMREYALKENDDRAVEYQTKTAIHEAFHLKAHCRETDFDWDPDAWRAMEETFAETSAHYSMELMGHEGVIHPAYPHILVETLPRLKQTEEFADCTRISDFGKIALEKRLDGGGSKWLDLHKKLYSQDFDMDEYVKRYAKSIEKNADRYLEASIAANPQNRPVKSYMENDLKFILDKINAGQSIKRLTSNHELVLSNVLLAAMNEEGVY